jgi:osmotically inducible protein OsmC
MPKRQATAQWEGTLAKGEGQLNVQSGAFDGRYSFGSRFENQPGTNPEELIGAAHAGCFSMALSLMIEKAGFTPRRIQTRATVNLEKVGDGFEITGIHLDTEAEVPDMNNSQFQEQAEAAKTGCPVSRALTGTKISLTARLL